MTHEHECFGNSWPTGYGACYAHRVSTLPTAAASLSQDEAFAEFGAYVEENRERYNVPGVAVVVVQGDEVVFAQGFGVKEAGGADPITPDTVFSIGSLTKPMTAMMAATLVDEGLIGLGYSRDRSHAPVPALRSGCHGPDHPEALVFPHHGIA